MLPAKLDNGDTTSNMQDTPQNNSNDSLSVNGGNGLFSLHATGGIARTLLKWLAIISLMMAGFVGYLYVDGFFDKYYNISKLAAGEKRTAINSKISEIEAIIDDWNEYDGIRSTRVDGYERSPKLVKRIIEKLPPLISLLEEAPVTEYEPKYRYFLHYNRALLYMIKGDLEQDRLSISLAMREKQKAKNLFLDNYSKSNPKFKKYIDDQYDEFRIDIIRDDINIYALMAHLHNDESFKKKAMIALRENFGGCIYFYDFTVTHKTIMSVLECHFEQDKRKIILQ